jgi:CRP/FNR family transcriptional regulator, cyclic AMP receptor protein
MGRLGATKPLPLASRTVAGRDAGGRVPDDLPGTTRSFGRGASALMQGSVPPGLFVVLEGVLREGAVSDQGRWFLHEMLGPGQVFGSLDGEPSPVSVRAAEPSRTVLVHPDHLGELWRRDPDVVRWLLGAIERRLLDAREVVHELAWLDVAERLKRRLARLAQVHGSAVPGGTRIEAPLTQEELAAMVGATRETVNRAVVTMVAGRRIRLDGRRYVLAPSRPEGGAGAREG